MSTAPQEDPVLRSARREMIVTFVIVALALSWSVGYAAAYGYLADTREVELTGVKESLKRTSGPAVVYVRNKATGEVVRTVHFVWGIPDWIMWGVIVPWGVCVVVSVAFGATFMRDEDLGEDLPEEGGRDV